MDNFIDPSKYKHYLILDGERIEAIVAYQEIYSLAKKSIYIIDDYIDIKTLQLLKVCKSNIEIIYHCGASSKDSGKKINTIMKIEDNYAYNLLFKELLGK